jgi:competence protein ComEA
MTVRLLVLWSIAVAAAVAAQPPDETTFPQGAGRETTLRVCSACHTADTALAQLKSHEDWAKTLELMADNGAQASDEQWSEIQKYLDINYTYIFVNKASADDLKAALDVTAEVAERIVRRRTDKGDFASVDDLKAVPGVGAATVDSRRERFIF